MCTPRGVFSSLVAVAVLGLLVVSWHDDRPVFDADCCGRVAVGSRVNLEMARRLAIPDAVLVLLVRASCAQQTVDAS